MEMREYQQFVERYILERKKGIEYPVLGLCGETGEVAEKVKKLIRDKSGVLDNETKKEIGKELGDVLWYVVRVGLELGLSLDDIATMNLEKLQSRVKRDVVKGAGDNR